MNSPMSMGLGSLEKRSRLGRFKLPSQICMDINWRVMWRSFILVKAMRSSLHRKTRENISEKALDVSRIGNVTRRLIITIAA